MKIAITTTTIFSVTNFVREYAKNIKKYGHEKDVQIIIAGDRKQPSDADDVTSLYKKEGINVIYLDIPYQLEYFKKYNDLLRIIPENSDNRRNLAYLYALGNGAELIISVDDDNFPLEDIDFVGSHLCVGEIVEAPEATGKNGWFNLCQMLNPHSLDLKLYPRGYPYIRRNGEMNTIGGLTKGKVAINAGLWIGDPDTDAIGRLYASPKITHFSNNSYILGKRILSPINTQNTAISKEAMSAYYYVRMGYMINGMRLDRFGDILSGYFVQLCANAVNDRVRIGSPVAEHRRNTHNLFIDLYNELAGIMMIEDLAPFFENINLPNDSYRSAYIKLSKQLSDFVENKEGFIWGPETKIFIRDITSSMRIWADVIDDLD